jgi:hypothetical protein
MAMEGPLMVAITVFFEQHRERLKGFAREGAGSGARRRMHHYRASDGAGS